MERRIAQYKLHLLLCLCALMLQSVSLTAHEGIRSCRMPGWTRHALDVSMKQAERMAEVVGDSSLLPRSIQKGLVPTADWTSGFFPGTLWYLYEYTGGGQWKARAERATQLLEREQYNANDHDIGFRMYCSYGNGWLLTRNKNYKDVIVRSARTLASRYTYKTGVILSWQPDTLRQWQYPVIIDNMMNLELLMEAYKLSGDTTLRRVAVSHADRTLKYHYRADYSCPHVVDYDAESGAVRKHDWNNGLDDARRSAWSRGQSWGLYGFTMMYRETRNRAYLRHADSIASYILNHPHMPSDLIPYWDYNGMHLSKMRDSSAAAILASGLLELSTYSGQGGVYFKAAEKILQSLSSSEYLAAPGTHHHFILKHATGNYIWKSELDGALSYADYYFVEALLRYVKLINNKQLY